MGVMKIPDFSRRCESPACARRRGLWWAWIEALRGYSLDGHWYCSPECFEQALAFTLGQLLPLTAQSPVLTHRVPLGLLMLSRGLVNDEQLKRALKAQKDSGGGRVGEWLRHMGAVNEEQVTQTLGLQWSVPVFPLSQSRRFLECAHLVPYPLLEAAEMVPVHYLPGSQYLYVAFIDHINFSALCSVEKMLECHTEPCLALQSQLHRALKELRDKPCPTEILVGNISDPAEMASAIFSHVERQGSADVRISGFNGFAWARILSPPKYTDLLFRATRNEPEIILPPDSQP